MPLLASRGRRLLPPRVTNRATATLVALFLAALTLRPQIVGVGPSDPVDPGRVRDIPCRRGPPRHHPGALHGAVRAGGRLPRGKDRDASGNDDRARPHRHLRDPPGDDAVGLARRPPDVAGRDRDGPRKRSGADLRQGALREEACHGDRRLHDRHPDRLDERGRARSATGRVVRWVARRADRDLLRRAPLARRLGRSDPR